MQSRAVVVRGMLVLSVARRNGSKIVSGSGEASWSLMVVRARCTDSPKGFLFFASRDAAICSKAVMTNTVEPKAGGVGRGVLGDCDPVSDACLTCSD